MGLTLAAQERRLVLWRHAHLPQLAQDSLSYDIYASFSLPPSASIVKSPISSAIILALIFVNSDQKACKKGTVVSEVICVRNQTRTRTASRHCNDGFILQGEASAATNPSTISGLHNSLAFKHWAWWTKSNPWWGTGRLAHNKQAAKKIRASTCAAVCSSPASLTPLAQKRHVTAWSQCIWSTFPTHQTDKPCWLLA